VRNVLWTDEHLRFGSMHWSCWCLQALHRFLLSYQVRLLDVMLLLDQRALWLLCLRA
jgi:hypothetical protein